MCRVAFIVYKVVSNFVGFERMLPSTSTLAEATVRVIMPYLSMLLNKLGEGTVKKASADSWDMAKVVYQKLWDSAKDDEAMKAALEQAASDPANEDYQQALKAKLIMLLAQKEHLGESLAESLSAAQLLSPDRHISIGGNVSNSQFITGDHNHLTINKATSQQPTRIYEVENASDNGSQTFIVRDEGLV